MQCDISRVSQVTFVPRFNTLHHHEKLAVVFGLHRTDVIRCLSLSKRTLNVILFIFAAALGHVELLNATLSSGDWSFGWFMLVGASVVESDLTLVNVSGPSTGQ